MPIVAFSEQVRPLLPNIRLQSSDDQATVMMVFLVERSNTIASVHTVAGIRIHIAYVLAVESLKKHI